jgi:hypothetical protein
MENNNGSEEGPHMALKDGRLFPSDCHDLHHPHLS